MIQDKRQQPYQTSGCLAQAGVFQGDQAIWGEE